MIRLPRFTAGQSVVSETGSPSPALLRYFNDNATAITKALNDLVQARTDIGTNATDTSTALTAAQGAQTTVDGLQSTVTALTKQMSLSLSYVSGVTLTAALNVADPTKADITISTHQRHYGDGTSATVTGAILHGVALSTALYIIYSDHSRSGGTVSYSTTTDLLAASQIGDQHLVGLITTPAAGATTSTTGTVLRPPVVLA